MELARLDAPVLGELLQQIDGGALPGEGEDPGQVLGPLAGGELQEGHEGLDRGIDRAGGPVHGGAHRDLCSMILIPEL